MESTAVSAIVAASLLVVGLALFGVCHCYRSHKLKKDQPRTGQDTPHHDSKVNTTKQPPRTTTSFTRTTTVRSMLPLTVQAIPTMDSSQPSGSGDPEVDDEEAPPLPPHDEEEGYELLTPASATPTELTVVSSPDEPAPTMEVARVPNDEEPDEPVTFLGSNKNYQETEQEGNTNSHPTGNDQTTQIAHEITQHPPHDSPHVQQQQKVPTTASMEPATLSRSEMDTLFQELDKNGDGTLSLKEVEKAMFQRVAPQFQLKPAIVFRAFETADRNGNGCIDKEEWCIFLQLCQYFQTLQTVFDSVDHNGDRQLTCTEFVQAANLLGIANDKAHAIFEEINQQHLLGYIVFDDFCLWMAQHHYPDQQQQKQEEEEEEEHVQDATNPSSTRTPPSESNTTQEQS